MAGLSGRAVQWTSPVLPSCHLEPWQNTSLLWALVCGISAVFKLFINQQNFFPSQVKACRPAKAEERSAGAEVGAECQVPPIQPPLCHMLPLRYSLGFQEHNLKTTEFLKLQTFLLVDCRVGQLFYLNELPTFTNQDVSFLFPKTMRCDYLGPELAVPERSGGAPPAYRQELLGEGTHLPSLLRVVYFWPLKTVQFVTFGFCELRCCLMVINWFTVLLFISSEAQGKGKSV